MEGMLTADGTAAPGVHDDPGRAPEPDGDAPRGWTWNRRNRKWQPKVRGPVLWHQDAPAGDEPGGRIEQQHQDYGPDPAPSWQADPAPPAEQWEPDPEDRKDIRALVALCYTVPAETLPLIDPFCFGPLTERDTANGVIDAVSDIVCQSPKVARWAASKSGLMPWLKLGMALKPVAVNGLHHHITKSITVEIDRENRTMEITETDWTQYPAG